MATKDVPDTNSPKQDGPNKPVSKPAKVHPKKPTPSTEDDPYDQGDIATPRRDPPYEDGI